MKYQSRKQRCDTVRTSTIVVVTTKAIKMGVMFLNSIKLLLFGICLLTGTCLFTFPTATGVEGRLFCVIYEIVMIEFVCQVSYILF